MPRLTEDARGVYVIAATPFTDTGAVDEASTERLVEFYIEEGVHGMTALGIMGEAPKLTLEEQDRFMRHLIGRVAGRVPVIVGVSNPGIDNLAALSHAAMDAGAAGVMVAGMPGLKTEDQALGYFAKVMAALDNDVPVCLQDYPPTTMVHLSVATINKLIADYPGIKMFKHEDAPGHRKLSAVRRAPEETGLRRVSILVGNGALYVPQEMRRGADGIMTGFAFPGMLAQVFELFGSGETEAAEDLFDLYLPVIRHEQQFGFGLALRKETLVRRGVIAGNKARDPGPSLDADDQTELTALLDRLKTKLQAAGYEGPSGL